ncbi:uncharacterized protein [Watersipora subatra]|uniref:uncharacterized protein n=1 Tax=Watersipora subatra TaxID=2589382 RepID=UPI00355B25EF
MSKHKIISIAEFSLRSKQEEKRTCSVHKGQVLSFGCRKCSDILCEDCIDEEGACSGSRHTSAPLKKLYSEAKERIELLKDKVEEKKSTLLFLSKESDRVLTDYGEETERMRKLIHKTRDEQLKEINTLYENLEEEFNEKRQETEGIIVNFKDNVVESELSHLNTISQRILVSLKQDHLVDVIRNNMQAELELNNRLAKELPTLRITEATGLTINERKKFIDAETSKIDCNTQISKSKTIEKDGDKRPERKKVIDAATSKIDCNTQISKSKTIEKDGDKRPGKEDQDGLSKSHQKFYNIISPVQKKTYNLAYTQPAHAVGTAGVAEDIDAVSPTATPTTSKIACSCCGSMMEISSRHCIECGGLLKPLHGDQPEGGTMISRKTRFRLPGYGDCGTIEIRYVIPGGVQGPEHYHPGQAYQGTRRNAFLPDNRQGQRAERLLRKAFERRLVFTIGRSVTTGQENSLVWNGIHHKTRPSGGPSNYGYPDPEYMDRLIEELRAKGITD